MHLQTLIRRVELHAGSPITSDERVFRRLRALCTGLNGAYLIAFVAAVIFGTDLPTLLFCAVGLLFCAATYLLVREPLAYLLLTHPSWMFLLTALLYADGRGRPLNEGLYAPATSLAIVMWYQFAILIAFCATQILKPLLRSCRFPSQSGTISTRSLWFTLLASCLLIVTPAAVAKLSFLLALSTLGITTFWLSATYLAQRSSLRARAAIVGIALLIGALMSLAMNQRAWLLNSVLFLTCFAICYLHKILTVRNLLLSTVAILCINVFSAVTLDIRARGAQDSVADSISMYTRALAQAQTWERAFSPVEARPTTVLEHGRLTAFVTNFYGDGGGGLLERLTLLPQLDIVAARFGSHPPLRTGAILGQISAALPNFGQEKDTIYSDRLVWDLGLRRVTVVARPMVTAAAEFYSMGGPGVMLFVVAPLFALIFAQTFRIRNTVSYSNYFFIVVSSSIYIVFSSTALSVTAVAVRCLPVALLVTVLFERHSALWRRANVNTAMSSVA